MSRTTLAPGAIYMSELMAGFQNLSAEVLKANQGLGATCR